MVVGQLPAMKIAANPKSNPNTNSNPNHNRRPIVPVGNFPGGELSGYLT